MVHPVGSSLDKIVGWAEEFHRQSEKKDQRCFIRPRGIPDTPPYEFIKKKNFMVDFFVNVAYAVKTFFSFDPQVKMFADVTEEVTADEIAWLSDKKIGEVFGSVQNLFHYLEAKEIWPWKKNSLKKLDDARHKLTNLFVNCIKKKIQDQIKGGEISFSEEGTLLFYSKDKNNLTLEALLNMFGIEDPLLQKETVQALCESFRKDEATQKGIADALVAFYQKKCGDASQNMDTVLRSHSKGYIWGAPVNQTAINGCATVIYEFQKSYVPFLESVTAFFAKGSNVLTNETMERVTNEIKKQYGSKWEALLSSKKQNIQLGLIQANVFQMSEFTAAIIQGLETAKNVPEERAGHILAWLQTIIEDAERYEEAVKNKPECALIARDLRELLKNARAAQQKLSARIRQKPLWKRERGSVSVKGDVIINIGKVDANANIQVVVNSNTGDIINKPYVQTVQKTAQAFQEQQKGPLQRILGQTITSGVAGGIQGFVFGGVPGMVTMGIASATAVLATSMLEQAGLPTGISNVIGMTAALATSAYTAQYVSTYLQGKIAPPEIVAPQAQPVAQKPSGYLPGKEPIASKQMAEAYQAQQKAAAAQTAPLPKAQELPLTQAPAQPQVQPQKQAGEVCGFWCRFKKGAAYGEQVGNVVNVAAPILGAIPAITPSLGGISSLPGLGSTLLGEFTPLTIASKAIGV